MLRHRGPGRSTVSTERAASPTRKRRYRWHFLSAGIRSARSVQWRCLRWYLCSMGGTLLLLSVLFLYFEAPLGALVDSYLRQRYSLHLLRQQKERYAAYYPDVTVKATRRVEHHHYSYYLYELLHQLKSPPSAKEEEEDPALPIVSPVPLRPWWNHCLPLVRWLCQRCWHTGFYGSIARCPAPCAACYDRSAPAASLKPIPLPRRPHDDSYHPSSIPRRIHQAGASLIRSAEYPELARLQATWRSLSQYEYSFYTADDQVAFLKEHYDPRLLEIYQSLSPNAMEQRHFFALLVLYRYGGIYADPHVQWQLSLSPLLLQGTSLILPRSAHLLQRHCLDPAWVAAAPGHPVLAQLIIQQASRTTRADANADTPIWKWHVAAETDYRYGGACAWGSAVNTVLQRPLTEDFNRLGHYRIPSSRRSQVTGQSGNATTGSTEEEENDDWGPILILMMSDHDTGATRITELERNLLVATVHRGLEHRLPVSQRAAAAQRDAALHRWCDRR